MDPKEITKETEFNITHYDNITLCKNAIKLTNIPSIFNNNRLKSIFKGNNLEFDIPTLVNKLRTSYLFVLIGLLQTQTVFHLHVQDRFPWI